MATEDDYDNDQSWRYAGGYGSAPTQGALMQTMTTKIAPAFDGKTSWFKFDEDIDDWCDITELEPEKRGPALRNRLIEDASPGSSWTERN